MTRSLDQLLDNQLLPDLPASLGVAVSGGSDSMALLRLLHDFVQRHPLPLFCVTVDHGLRKEAASEAQSVAEVCRQLGVPHDTLTWDGWDGSGNTQNAARMARYRLMSNWAQQRGVSAIALGHTQDDQAETVLMRLSRGAGVDGLSAMSPKSDRWGLTWLRPLLNVSRADLRAYLTDHGLSWIDDPTNEDTRYDRIKARKALDQLEAFGLTRAALGQVAQNMAQARTVLLQQTVAAARDVANVKAGALRLDWSAVQHLPNEISRRLIVRALQWISGAVYAPRQRSTAAAMQAVQTVGSATLEGCHLRLIAGGLWIFREYKAVEAASVPLDELWDGRWIVTGPEAGTDLRIAALGEQGLSACPHWRDTGLPRALLLATPAVWRGEELVAAPLADPASEWRAELKKGGTSFFAAVFSH